MKTTTQITEAQVITAFIGIHTPSQIKDGNTCEACNDPRFYITDGKQLGYVDYCDCNTEQTYAKLRPWGELVELASFNPEVAAQLELV